MQNIHGIYLTTIIVLYCFSVLGYFIDFIQHNRKVNRIAFWLLSVVWLLQTIFFIKRMIELERFPIVTSFESLFFYTWVIVTLSLVINWFFRVELLVFFTNVVGFIMMAFSLFTPSADIPEAHTQLLLSELSIIHITIILISYGAFTLAFVFALMYVIEYHMLKKKLWGKRMIRFGSLLQLDKLSYMMTIIGFPVFIIGILLGMVRAFIEFHQLPWHDAKIISSIVVMIVYAIYFYLRAVRLVRGYNMALLNIVGFLIVLINYFLSGSFSKFHIWT